MSIPNILALDVAGNPHRWISYEQAAFYYAKDLIAWQMGGDFYTLRGGINRSTNTQSRLDINTIIAIKGKVHERKNFNAPLKGNKALFRRDKNICAYCGERHPNSELTRDHVIPTSKGGKDKWMNIVTACKPCNRRKSDHLLEDINMDLLYVPYIPNRAEYLILMNRKILADQMDFLLTKVPKDSRVHM